MLRSVKSIIGYSLRAQDGEIGEVVDAYFDDINWIIRYLIVDSSSWFYGKRVLISPVAFAQKPDWLTRQIPVVLSRQEVRQAPDVDTQKPVSRKKELELAGYYGWPTYWKMPEPMPVTSKAQRKARDEAEKEEDFHLRSVKEIFSYQVLAKDSQVGQAHDFIFEDSTWKLRYLAVEIGSLLSSRKILISRTWVSAVNWQDGSVVLNINKDDALKSPDYDPGQGVNKEYEEHVYDYYGRPKKT